MFPFVDVKDIHSGLKEQFQQCRQNKGQGAIKEPNEMPKEHWEEAGGSII